MLTHKDVWRGIDQLAARNGFSASGLARRAGLDPTTFNKSKRITAEGKPRWPSTESVSKILDATKTSMADFVSLMYGQPGSVPAPTQRLRSLAWSAMVRDSALDASGFPQGNDWEEVEIPLTDDPRAFAIELDSDVAAPAMRSGDTVIVSPTSSIRRGDRVLLRRRDGSYEIGILARRTAQRITLGDILGQQAERALAPGQVGWMVRIVWVSQ